MDAEYVSFEVTRMARRLDVSKASFYNWRRVERRGVPLPSEQRDDELNAKILSSQGIYDEPRITSDLHERGDI